VSRFACLPAEAVHRPGIECAIQATMRGICSVTDPITTQTERKLSTLERNLLGMSIKQIPRLLPGLLAAVLLAWLSIWLSDWIGETLLGFDKTPISAVMVAIVLGIVVRNTLPFPSALNPGLRFSVKKILRLGIILLGIRLSIFDVFRLGAIGMPVVVLCILGALLITTRLNRWLKLPERLGILIAVGTSICGVSAIVATGPAIDAKDEELAYAVAVITVFGILATLLYPYVAFALFDGDAVKAGLFLGTAIHDTSQVTGAGLVFADLFGLPKGLDVATITKLVRNVFMTAVIPLMALYTRSAAKKESDSSHHGFRQLFPRFILGFVALAVLRSIGDAGVNAGARAFGLWDTATWQAIYGQIEDWAVRFLVLALSAVGLSTSFHTVRRLGAKPFLVGLGAALAVGVVSFVAISLLGTFILS